MQSEDRHVNSNPYDNNKTSNIVSRWLFLLVSHFNIR